MDRVDRRERSCPLRRPRSRPSKRSGSPVGRWRASCSPFSLTVGLTIGLIIRSLAAFALLLVARRSLRRLEAAGFLIGVAPAAILFVIGNA
jgi:hypothetical protein